MLTDYEFRGHREPLCSMGLYHYAMYVYKVPMPEEGEPGERDWLLYHFAAGHPDEETHVQRLRAYRGYKVPLLLGWTHCTEAKDPEENAKYKAALLRSYHGSDGYGVLVDADGLFAGHWAEWFEEQRRLAERARAKEDRAGKLHLLEDVFVWEQVRPGMRADLEEAQRPSPAEFFAGITVRVATH